jgi:hypothetical protein
VVAIDGIDLFDGCAMGLSACYDSRPCPLQKSFIHIRDELAALLDQTNIHEMAHSLEDGLTFLKRIDSKTTP